MSRSALLERLSLVRSEIELVSFLHAVASSFEFSTFAFFKLPAASDKLLEPLVGLTNAPIKFFRDFDGLDILHSSKAFVTLRRSITPITWDSKSVDAAPPSEEKTRIQNFLKQYNITTCVILPVHNADGERAAVMLMGLAEKLSMEELSELNLFVIHAYDVYDKITNKKTIHEKMLTMREIEVLQWAANGKTSSEIGSILSISDHTVNTYMNAAMRKLDCVNRTQLVAKALRLHLISINV